MEFKLRIFVIAFVLSFATGALSTANLFLPRTLRPDVFGLAWFILKVVEFFLNPVLVFVSFYLLGRKIDLVAEFMSVLLSLFLGSWFGHMTGYFSLQFTFITWYGGTFVVPTVLWVVWYAFTLAFSLEFFVGFTAFSMVYIVRKRLS